MLNATSLPLNYPLLLTFNSDLMYNLVILLSLVLSVVAQTTSPCLSSGDETTINQLFSSGGAGTVVQICPNTFIIISNTISFTAPDQELSTYGYPTDASRATIQIAASPANSVSTLVFGRSLSGVRLLNIVLDGNRPNTGLITSECILVCLTRLIL